MELLTSSGNPRVKAWAALKERKYREQSGAYLVEGLRSVAVYVERGAPLQALLFDSMAGRGEDITELADICQEHGVPVYELTASLIAQIADTKHPQGIIAIARIVTPDILDVLDRQVRSGASDVVSRGNLAGGFKRPIRKDATDGFERPVGYEGGADSDFARGNSADGFERPVRRDGNGGRTPPLACADVVLVADGVKDPGNLGTMIRSAAAVGARAFVTTGNAVDFYNPKVVRAAMGALAYVPVLSVEASRLTQALRQHGYRLVCADAHAERSLYETDLCGPLALALGSEVDGLSPELRSQADDSLSVPMPGNAESLNAGVAATVVLYEALRQRIAPGGTARMDGWH
ncbi:MAG: TrmH family RNA methyltransferase [Bacilli bacterium]